MEFSTLWDQRWTKVFGSEVNFIINSRWHGISGSLCIKIPVLNSLIVPAMRIFNAPNNSEAIVLENQGNTLVYQLQRLMNTAALLILSARTSRWFCVRWQHTIGFIFFCLFWRNDKMQQFAVKKDTSTTHDPTNVGSKNVLDQWC